MHRTFSMPVIALFLLPISGCGGASERADAVRLAAELREGSSAARQAASVALRRMGPAGFEALRPLLADADPLVRTRAAFVWKGYADASPRHLDLACRLSGDAAWTVRREAARVLGRAASRAPRAVEALLEAAAVERQPTVLESLAQGLGRAPGSHAAEVTPRLVQLARHGAPSVRAAAVRSLGQIGGGHPGARAAVLAAMTDDPSPLVRVRAATAAWRLTTMRPRVLPLLEGGLRSKHDGVPEAALDGLEALGSAAEPAVPSLVQLLDDQTLRVRAAETLGAMGPVAEAALPRLLRARRDPSSWFREAAERAVRLIRGS